MFHPATLLLVWVGFVGILGFLPSLALGLMVPPALAGALVVAPERTRHLLRRARWLLLSIAVLFAFGTPGLALPEPWPAIGLTQDGLQLAGEHVARLLLLLTTLALLHEYLGSPGLVVALYALLRPLRRWGGMRERIVVRLMLVIEFVDSVERPGWRHWLGPEDFGPQQLGLTVERWRWRDGLLLVAVGMIVMTMVW